MDAIRYLVDNGCKWRALPSDFPPWRTVYGFFTRWAKTGVLQHLRDQSWQMRARRDARDYERLPEHPAAHITWTNITS